MKKKSKFYINNIFEEDDSLPCYPNMIVNENNKMVVPSFEDYVIMALTNKVL